LPGNQSPCVHAHLPQSLTLLPLQILTLFVLVGFLSGGLSTPTSLLTANQHQSSVFLSLANVHQKRDQHKETCTSQAKIESCTATGGEGRERQRPTGGDRDRASDKHRARTSITHQFGKVGTLQLLRDHGDELSVCVTHVFYHVLTAEHSQLLGQRERSSSGINYNQRSTGVPEDDHRAATKMVGREREIYIYIYTDRRQTYHVSGKCISDHKQMSNACACHTERSTEAGYRAQHRSPPWSVGLPPTVTLHTIYSTEEGQHILLYPLLFHTYSALEHHTQTHAHKQHTHTHTQM
jgi:hypothetical protein